MAYINLFAKEKDYHSAKDGLEVPSVSLIEESGKVILSSDAQPSQFVDLGLPSGIKWATCNIGASNIEEDGMFFSWGNIQGHYDDEGYNFNQNTYDNTAGHGLSDDIPVNSTYDAARAILGDKWRMPTEADFQELIDNCTYQFVNVRGKKGALFISKINGKSVFFPASGFFDGTLHIDVGSNGRFWSSTFSSSGYARILRFFSGFVTVYDITQCCGYSVRAVQD